MCNRSGLKQDPARQLGSWAGATVQAVPQAIACGFTFSATAGNIATVVKLIRVLLLGPYIIIIRLIISLTNKRTEEKSPITVKALINFFPAFILLFFMVVLINSYLPIKTLTLFNATLDIRQLLIHFSSLLLAMALAAIGLQTNLRLLIQQSRHYLLLGLISTLLATAVTLLFIRML
ncbi:MAG: putative sulfate exporter family transporter [Gammaproteobacteria bacterium]|nr:putative sulfate exporter family transporter [Gammaproteobacteria bacterium]